MPRKYQEGQDSNVRNAGATRWDTAVHEAMYLICGPISGSCIFKHPGLMQVNPHIKKEKWTDDEDDRLAMLVRQFGSAWAEIARRMRGRTDQQCMGRWRRHLDPSIRYVLKRENGSGQ